MRVTHALVVLDKSLPCNSPPESQGRWPGEALLGLPCHCNRTYSTRMPWNDVVDLHCSWIPRMYSPPCWKFTCSPQINAWVTRSMCRGTSAWSHLCARCHQLRANEAELHLFTAALLLGMCPFLVYLVPHFSRLCFSLVILLFKGLVSIEPKCCLVSVNQEVWDVPYEENIVDNLPVGASSNAVGREFYDNESI